MQIWQQSILRHKIQIIWMISSFWAWSLTSIWLRNYIFIKILLNYSIGSVAQLGEQYRLTWNGSEDVSSNTEVATRLPTLCSNWHPQISGFYKNFINRNCWSEIRNFLPQLDSTNHSYTNICILKGLKIENPKMIRMKYTWPINYDPLFRVISQPCDEIFDKKLRVQCFNLSELKLYNVH